VIHAKKRHSNERNPGRSECVPYRCLAALGVPAQQAPGREAETANLIGACRERHLRRSQWIDVCAAIFVQQGIRLTQPVGIRLAVVAHANKSITALRRDVLGEAPNATARASEWDVHGHVGLVPPSRGRAGSIN